MVSFGTNPALLYNARRRAPAHCGMVNLVRSGTKQPQPTSASAAVKARLSFPFFHIFFHVIRHIAAIVFRTYSFLTSLQV